MKRLVISLCVLISFATMPMAAQTMVYDLAPKKMNCLQQWEYALSPEGKKDWKPEFTIRKYTYLFAGGHTVSAGIRVDNKRTLGITAAKGVLHYTYPPEDDYYYGVGFLMRRYFHLGKKDIFAFYSDLNIGIGHIYKVYYNLEDKTRHPGVYGPLISWQPGFRVRFWRNIHLFCGLGISTETVGVYSGIGF